jgi:amidase
MSAAGSSFNSMDSILSLSAVQQASLIRQRKISSVELVEAHMRRIAELQPSLNAVTEVLCERALADARRADEMEPTGPLHGVPFSIKDSIEVAGTVSTAGTTGRAGASAATEDATLVAQLRAAGAIPIAKTNLPELLFAFESDNYIFGRTANPYDLTRTAGGSSGGEAALIAACGSPMGLGSDCAGSVRLPAAFCGIAGIKPTSGRLPRTGHFPPAGGWITGLWQLGPMARFVEDVTLMMELLAGADGVDPTAVASPFQPTKNISHLRVAFYTDNGFAKPTQDVSLTVQAAARALAAEVAMMEEKCPACLADAYDLEMKLLGADGGDSLRQYHAGLGSARMHPLLSGWLDKLECYRTDLRGFQTYWEEWDRYRAEMAAFFRQYDAIVCPAYTQTALAHGTSTDEENFRGFSHTIAYNVAGLPGAVVRCGASAAGLPIAVQIVAPPWREDVALAIAAFLERAMGGWKAPPAAGW